MYIAIAILAAIFAVNTPARTVKTEMVATPQQQTAPAAPKAVPVLIDSRFSTKEKAMPWEKDTDPAEFLPSARTC